MLFRTGKRYIRGMHKLTHQQRQELGMQAADAAMFQQDQIWSRYSNDKVDIAHTLAFVIRVLSKSLPLRKKLTALSVGSSNEPQFRILESAFQGGLYLLDVDKAALGIVDERIQRQRTPHVRTIPGDYNVSFHSRTAARQFRADWLDGHRMTLITLHHSLYYTPQSSWSETIGNLYREILARVVTPGTASAIHVVLMSSRSKAPLTTTQLYNHFAGRFFSHNNDQDLLSFAGELRKSSLLGNAHIGAHTSRVEFMVDDFQKFMAVIWMILLHPEVHNFSQDQQREVIEHVYRTHWVPQKPLVQMQDHLVIFRGAMGS